MPWLAPFWPKKWPSDPPLAEGDWWHIVAAGLLTCLLPDIDHPKSVLGQRLTWLSVPIARLCGHRGFTHSLLTIITGILLFTLRFPPQSIIPLDVFHAMIIGHLSHIAADILTPAGVPLLWPLSLALPRAAFAPRKGQSAGAFGMYRSVDFRATASGRHAAGTPSGRPRVRSVAMAAGCAPACCLPPDTGRRPF